MGLNNVSRNLIKVGEVSSINDVKGSVDVLFDDKDNLIVDDLPLLNFEYHMPEIGEQVLCVFLANGIEQGFCLGGFFSNVFPPPAKDRSVFKKQIDEDMYLEYNKDTKHLQVIVDDVELKVHNGTVKVSASQILLGGDATEGVPLGNELKRWLDNHTHSYSWTDSGGSGTSDPPINKSPSPSSKVKTT